MNRISVPLVLAWLTAGCATAYQPNGITGGFSETQLAPDLFRVSFRGNGYTSGERAQDFALLRAAELTLQNGFTHFAILNENNSTSSQTITTPGYTQTSGSVAVHGNYATYSDTTTYMPSQTFAIHRPNSGMTFRAFKTPPSGVFVFDAVFLQGSLRNKYNVKAQ